MTKVLKHVEQIILQEQYDWMNRSFSPSEISDTLELLYEYAATLGITLNKPEGEGEMTPEGAEDYISPPVGDP
jgi:hypothetical protein